MKSSYIPNHEFIIYATKGRHILRGKRSADVMDVRKDAPSKYVHPTQKPVELMAGLIEKSTDPRGIVLDLFMGSGSTGVACANTERRFIGIEIDPGYYEIAQKRIEEAYNK